MTENDRSQKHSTLFMELAASFQLSALQGLGKLVDPRTGKAEVNLEGAAASIDMLDMLAAKTRGNLNAEESSYLNQTLSFLKLNYVEELNKPKKETPPAEEGQASDQDQPEPPPPNSSKAENRGES